MYLLIKKYKLRLPYDMIRIKTIKSKEDSKSPIASVASSMQQMRPFESIQRMPFSEAVRDVKKPG
jgi:hypothetical protein